MGIDAGRYREKRRKQLTLPSGDVATIRKPGRDSYMKLLDAQDLRDRLPELQANVDPVTGEMKDITPEKQKLLKDIMDTLDEVLYICIVEPKLSKTPSGEALGIDELDPADYFYLISEVFKFADLSEDKLKGLFRPSEEQSGKDGGEDIASGQSETKSDIEIGKSAG